MLAVHDFSFKSISNEKLNMLLSLFQDVEAFVHPRVHDGQAGEQDEFSHCCIVKVVGAYHVNEGVCEGVC